MKPITVNATELRNSTRDLMERVKYHGDIFVVETFGRPMAVIMSVEEYQRIQNSSRKKFGTRVRALSSQQRNATKKSRRKGSNNLQESSSLSEPNLQLDIVEQL